MYAPEPSDQTRSSAHSAGHPRPDDWHFASNDAVAAASLRPGFSAFLRARMTATSDIAAAELIYGELVANVILHAPGAIWIDVDWTLDGRARLQVRDTGRSFQYIDALPKCPLSAGSRGLYLVNAFAEEFSIDRKFSGNVVTVILPVLAADPDG